jgi:glycosyltransferase involved in cell wall biosynthesis
MAHRQSFQRKVRHVTVTRSVRRMAADVVCSDLAWEVIVVDDNSPDGTQDVARQLAATYGDDKIVLKPRAGKLGLGCGRLYRFDTSRIDAHRWVLERHTSMASTSAQEIL